MRGATDSREMILNVNVTAPHQSASQTASPQGEAMNSGKPRREAVGDSRLKRSSPVMSSLGASRHSPRRGKQENDEPPFGEAEHSGKPPKGEARER